MYFVHLIVFVHLIFLPVPFQEQVEATIAQEVVAVDEKGADLEEFAVNKIIPDEIRDVALKALSHFPELKEVHIEFKYIHNIKGSVMQAQPRLGSLLLKSKKNRNYRIKISRNLQLIDGQIPIEEVPESALLGWLGHELGHVMDYLNRGSIGMMAFGTKYYMSHKHLSEAEFAADRYAVNAGLGNEIVAVKNYILNHKRLPQAYKQKIRSLYPTPGEILSLVEEE
ncbi:hypothetical protein [Pararhodonellum marinum]|uniref:hypothetical protein n=1 Tax=Pararhodonellum marinum TaxID=2755358 RepID=UPI001E2BE90B|nr:hypothetical protein [Pararhodonellum marinum]